MGGMKPTCGRWKCLSTTDAFDRTGLHANNLTQPVKSSSAASILPNSLVKQHSSPPRARCHPLCAAHCKLWFISVHCPASLGARIHTAGPERAKLLFFLTECIVFLHALFFKTGNSVRYAATHLLSQCSEDRGVWISVRMRLAWSI